MRALVLLTFVTFSGCEQGPGAPRDASAGASATPVPTGAGGGGITIPEDAGPRLMRARDQCKCVPDDCTVEEPAVPADLCTSSGWVVVRTTFPGCSDALYTGFTWDYALTVTVRESQMTGCVVNVQGTGDPTGDTALTETCDQSQPVECAVCPEMAEPRLLENFRLPTCE